MIELFSLRCKDRSGEQDYSVRILHEFSQKDEYFNAQKVSEIWSKAREHDVLFSDYTAGKVEPFLTAIMNPNSVWFEIYRTSGEPGSVGVGYITHVIPKFDAKAHFAFWDRIASGREDIIWAIMGWLFIRYELHRLTAEVPKYQSGTIRFVKGLGFQHEGEIREAIIHKGSWMPLLIFGMTVGDFYHLMEEKHGRLSIREGEERDSGGDSRRDGTASSASPSDDDGRDVSGGTGVDSGTLREDDLGRVDQHAGLRPSGDGAG